MAESGAPRSAPPGARTAIVVGAGWAGCAAAVALARRGVQVTLLEAARNPGGRARRIELDGRSLDNGQHIVLGAYRRTLGLLRQLGVGDDAWLRLPLQMRYAPAGGGMDFVAAARLPAPLHVAWGLLRASGLERADKRALAQFSSLARWTGWQLDTDCSVSELLERWQQTARLSALMWRPLCIAALNTDPARASAQVFLNVLRDSLGARRAASDMLLPRRDLGALLPQHAAAFLTAHAGALHCGVRVQTLARSATGWRVQTQQAQYEAGLLVLATAAPAAASLLAQSGEAAAAPLCATLDAFEYEAITTCYLQYAPTLALAQPFYALRDDAAAGRWGQFVFDRGQLERSQAGLLAVVVSASGGATALPQAQLASLLGAQLAHDFARPELAQPRWARVVSEKRATFACTPGLLRPAHATALPGLWLAGDYTAGDYPATLEAAVTSGLEAGELAAAYRRG